MHVNTDDLVNMFQKKRYRYNHETLAYEIHRTPISVLFSRGFLLFLCTIATSVGYFWIYSNYLNLDTPKMLQLKRENADLLAKLDLMSHQIEKADLKLERLKQRDNNIYRPIFGMEIIPDEHRNMGFGGIDRYSYLDYSKYSGFVSAISTRFDQLYKKTEVQSRSFDDVGVQADQTDKMASSIPNILPVNLADAKFRLSGRFGWRNDPFEGDWRPHTGIDISGPTGSELYATGDGVVVKTGTEMTGYGYYVIIDHGFGIKTRYAHMKGPAIVNENQKVSRGEVIGYLGNTGRSKGPHVHYEVILKGQFDNPVKYFFMDLTPEEYNNMLFEAENR